MRQCSIILSIDHDASSFFGDLFTVGSGQPVLLQPFANQPSAIAGLLFLQALCIRMLFSRLVLKSSMNTPDEFVCGLLALASGHAVTGGSVQDEKQVAHQGLATAD